MDKKKLYTLALKFKRYNIQFEYDEKSKYLTFGKVTKVKRRLIKGLVILCISVFLLAFISLVNIPFLEKVLRYIVIFLSVIGISEIIRYFNYAAANKYKKFITPQYFIINSKDGDNEYDKENINDIIYEIDKKKDRSGQGTIYFELKEGGKIQILTLNDKNHVHLEDDFIYLKEFLEDFMQLIKNNN